LSRSLPYLASLLPFACLLAAGCDDGTTRIAIPIYEATVPEGGSAFQDSGTVHKKDGGTTSDAKSDATLDGGKQSDAAREAAPDARPSDSGGHPSDATAEAARDASEAAAPDAGHSLGDSGSPCVPDGGGDSGSCAPVCMDIGTANEGWYEPNGAVICTVPCSGLAVTCEHVGQGSQGWYTTTGHGCDGHQTEVLNDPSCHP
jgi:hypothetical protein